MIDRMVISLARDAGELGRLMTFIEGDPRHCWLPNFAAIPRPKPRPKRST
jgi:hypothetical protein